MATGGSVADGMASSLARLEHIVGKLRQIPISVWRKICIGVLSIWLTYTLAQLFWVFIPTPALPEPSLDLPKNTTFAERPADTANIDIEALKDLALFGEGAVDGEALSPALPSGYEEDAVDTSLNLKLVGTVASSIDRYAKAFIEDGSKQEIFSPGDEFTIGPRGVKLAKVMVDRVIIDNNGRFETLWLYQGKDDFKQSVRVTNYTRPTPRPSPRLSNPAESGDGDVIEDAGSVVSSLAPEEGQNLPTAAQIKTVNELINVNMHREGGQFIGFKINPKRNPELFAQLGLQPNDIVTAVNNIGLDDTSRAMEVYRSLSTSSQASLEILRDGNTINVDINLDN